MAIRAADSDALIHARGLTKRFTNLVAVDAIDFDVERGEAFGFLGPNGAGKTSTMRMIGCVSSPSAGTLRVLGMDPVQDGPRIRARLGVVPQAETLDTELLVDENLFTYARYFGIARDEARRRAGQLLDFVQLKDRARDRVEFLSGGMKRRLTIAPALVNEPDLLLLDEPTTGLDPQARHLVWDRLYRLKQRGTTLVLTTHYMDEAEQLCDRLVVMDKGKIVAEGTPRELIEHSTRPRRSWNFVSSATSHRISIIGWTGWSSERRCCPIEFCCTRPTEMRLWPRCTDSGSGPKAPSCAAARSRTCSSG